MEYRGMTFLNNFEKYDDCVPAGVLLPKVNIDKQTYLDLGLSIDCSSFDLLKSLCNKGFVEKGLNKKKNKQQYIDRCRYEIEVIENLKFTDYLLLNWQIIGWCLKNKIPVGSGRGSAPSSLILYLLNVTDIDPIQYNLFFERFVSKNRARKIEKNGITYLDGGLLADVDNDIAFDRRQEVIDFIKKEHEGKTCRILNLMTLGGKIVVKEVGKIIEEYSEEEVNEVTDWIPSHFGKTCRFAEAEQESEKFAEWAKNNQKIKKIAQKIEGLIKNTGVHASGIAISNQNLVDICPLQNTKEGELISCYDMNDVAEIMVKFDILGLKTLTVLQDACDQLNINFKDIDVKNEKLYDHFKDLKYPQGLFQLEANTNLQVCQEIKPRKLEDVSAVIAIARPGALQFRKNYADFLNKDEATIPDIESKELLDIIKETGYAVLFQETLMQIAYKVFGLSLEQAEMLRRACGKKKLDEMLKFKQIIEDKGTELNIPKSAEFYWKCLIDSANYSFNKCNFEEDLVELDNGKTVMLKNVKKGDKVKAYDVKNDKNHFVDVTNIYNNNREIYKVELEDGKFIRCSLDHKILCEDMKMRPLKEIVSKKLKIITG